MTKKKINWSKAYSYFVLSLMFVGFICFAIWAINREKKFETYLKNNYAYTIGCFDGTERVKTSTEYYFTHIYMDSVYCSNIRGPGGQDCDSIREVLDSSNIGDRFLVKLSPDNPRNASVILVDCPVPLDIARAPAEGWKEIPNWNVERANGNILNTPYDGSKYVKYVYPSNNNHIYFALIVLLFILPLFNKEIWLFLKELKQKW